MLTFPNKRSSRSGLAQLQQSLNTDNLRATVKDDRHSNLLRYLRGNIGLSHCALLPTVAADSNSRQED